MVLTLFIKAFRHLAVVQEIYLKNNLLEDISELTSALTQMQRIKKIDFRGNPITKVSKYRDYIVILSKSLGNFLIIAQNNLMIRKFYLNKDNIWLNCIH